MSDAKVNNDPDGLECYSDHAHDIRTVGECAMCGSTEPEVVGHVMPDIERVKNIDPVAAARLVVDTQTARIVDGVLLDYFTAQYIVGVYDALSEPQQGMLRSMNLVKAADICLRLGSLKETP